MLDQKSGHKSLCSMLAKRYSTMTSKTSELVNVVTKIVKNYTIVSSLESLLETVQTWSVNIEMTHMKLSQNYQASMRKRWGKMCVDLKNLMATLLF